MKNKYKVCNKCKILKDIRKFGLNNRNKDNHKNICKKCEKEARKEKEKENLKKITDFLKNDPDFKAN